MSRKDQRDAERARQRNALQNRSGASPQASLLAASHTEIRQEIRQLAAPAELQGYRDMDPELYEILKKEFAANGSHRRAMQVAEAEDRRTLVNAATRNDTLGLVLSWIFAVGCVSIGVYFIVTGRPAGIFLAVLGFLPSIIGAFRVRRTQKPNE